MESKKGAARGINEAAFVTIKTRKKANFFKNQMPKGTRAEWSVEGSEWKLAFIS